MQSVLARGQIGSDGNLIASSVQPLITVDQINDYHLAGHIAFGPDGYLYWSLGDNETGDPALRAQDPRDLHGKVMRIDVSSAPGYRIPAGNPFAASSTCPTGRGAAACAEIYALGFRNPWRFSFDAESRPTSLWLGDVGEFSWEEIDQVIAGGNYGVELAGGFALFRRACRVRDDDIRRRRTDRSRV